MLKCDLSCFLIFEKHSGYVITLLGEHYRKRLTRNRWSKTKHRYYTGPQPIDSKPGHSMGRSGRGAWRGPGWVGQDWVPTEVFGKETTVHCIHQKLKETPQQLPKTRTSEILLKPMAPQNQFLTCRWQPVDLRFITGLSPIDNLLMTWTASAHRLRLLIIATMSFFLVSENTRVRSRRGAQRFGRPDWSKTFSIKALRRKNNSSWHIPEHRGQAALTFPQKHRQAKSNENRWNFKNSARQLVHHHIIQGAKRALTSWLPASWLSLFSCKACQDKWVSPPGDKQLMDRASILFFLLFVSIRCRSFLLIFFLAKNTVGTLSFPSQPANR